MERLRKYFEQVRTATVNSRQVGIEVETLLVDATTGQSITLACSQQIMQVLTIDHGWTVGEKRGGKIVRLSKNDTLLFYELGWNNFELVSVPYLVNDSAALFTGLQQRLNELYSAAVVCGARNFEASFDGHNSNTLIMPDKRDEIWLELDGPVLPVLGHISSVHFNIDLVSLDEGFEWMQRLEELFSDCAWPPPAVSACWQKYLEQSYADYEPGRYGLPPLSFTEYCEALAAYKVVMQSAAAGLVIARPAQAFAENPIVDIDLFLRSVWWWNRLRVRGGQLVLEIRAAPRTTDTQMRTDYELIAEVLRL